MNKKAQAEANRCPICRRSGGAMFTDKMVRALGVQMEWADADQPLAVCSPCYGVLATHRFVVLQEALRGPKA